MLFRLPSALPISSVGLFLPNLIIASIYPSRRVTRKMTVMQDKSQAESLAL